MFKYYEFSKFFQFYILLSMKIPTFLYSLFKSHQFNVLLLFNKSDYWILRIIWFVIIVWHLINRCYIFQFFSRTRRLLWRSSSTQSGWISHDIWCCFKRWVLIFHKSGSTMFKQWKIDLSKTDDSRNACVGQFQHNFLFHFLWRSNNNVYLYFNLCSFSGAYT